MKSLLIASLVLTPFTAGPAFAASIEDHPAAGQHRLGAFAGARFRIAIGGEGAGEPRLGLAIAGIDYRRSTDGSLRARFAEGVEYGFAAKRGASLSLAGQPVRIGEDRLHASGGGGLSPKLIFAGIVGVIVIGGAVGVATAFD